MELALITAKQILILFILIFIGFFVVKAGVIGAELRKGFTDLQIKVVMPMLILNSYMSEFDPAIFSNLIRCFLMSAALILLGIIVTLIATKGVQTGDLPLLRFGCIFSNAAFMGYPLIQAMFGSEGLLYASAFVTAWNLYLWTFGIAMLSGEITRKTVVKKLATTPALIAIAIGLFVYLCRVSVPDVIKQSLQHGNNMNTPLSMFITGMMIAESDMATLMKNRLLALLIAMRLVIVPILGFALFFALHITGTTALVALILAACPSAAFTALFAIQYHYDEALGAGAVVFSTLLSIITLPLYAFLLTMVM